MALLFMEGFDSYASMTDLYEDDRFSQLVSGTDPVFETGRSSGSAIRFQNTAEETTLRLAQESTSTIYGGFAFKLNALVTSADTIIEVFSPGEFTNSFSVRVDGSERLQIVRGITDSLGVVSAPINVGQWYYVEYKVFIDSSVGTAELWIDGVSVASNTGLNTGGASGTTPDRVVLKFRSTNDMTIDDLYVGDNSGSDMTDRVGDVVVETLRPDGAGSSTQFTPSTGSNFENVDDSTPDADTTYNSSTTVGHKDLFTCGNISGNAGSVYAVQVTSKAVKQDAGNRILHNKVKSSATEADGGDQGLTVGSYFSKSDIFENDPNGGGAWTASAVDAMEIGYEVIS